MENKNITTTNQAYDEGFDAGQQLGIFLAGPDAPRFDSIQRASAYFQNTRFDECPYDHNTPEGRAWFGGYSDGYDSTRCAGFDEEI